MAMNVGDGKEDDVMMEVNTTPLIDVMLVLLIMLIITIPIQTHAVKLDMPQNLSAPPPETEPQVVDLELDFDGTVFWNGVTVPDPGAQCLRDGQRPEPHVTRADMDRPHQMSGPLTISEPE